MIEPGTDDHRVGISDDDWRAAILECLIGLGRDLGIQTTAEGIETADQLAILKALGCDSGQGYLLGRPMPRDDVRAFISTWERGPAEGEAVLPERRDAA